MDNDNELTRLAGEILQLEADTFEVSDYAENNDLLVMISSTTSSTTSTTSCSA